LPRILHYAHGPASDPRLRMKGVMTGDHAQVLRVPQVSVTPATACKSIFLDAPLASSAFNPRVCHISGSISVCGGYPRALLYTSLICVRMHHPPLLRTHCSRGCILELSSIAKCAKPPSNKLRTCVRTVGLSPRGQPGLDLLRVPGRNRFAVTR
jgi:hypothetical protein